MFDYIKLENDIISQMQNSLEKLMQEYNDIYILSLDCSADMDSIGIIANTIQYLDEQAEPDSEDYWYYKYCEEEWDLFDPFEDFKEISSYMKKYDEEFDEEFDNHREKVIETCINALNRFKISINKTYPNLLLTFNIREYLDQEERIKFFQMINSKDATKEYAEHIEDFV